MKTEIYLSAMQVPLKNLSKVLPRYSHLRKLEYLPKLHEKADRRIISLSIKMNEITGYIVQDFTDTLFLRARHFATSELDSMPLD